METKKTYAQFMLPGFLFPETEEIRVKSRDIKTLSIPRSAYALRFFDILLFKVPYPPGSRKIRVASRAINPSPLYNIGTKIYTLKEARKETKINAKRLGRKIVSARENGFREMEIKKIKYALKVRVGGFIPVKKGELVILVDGQERKVLKIR